MFTHWGDWNRSVAMIDAFRRQMERVVNDFDQGWFSPRRVIQQADIWPRANLFDVENKLLLQVEVPGLEQKDITITAHPEMLSISGERPSDAPEKYSVHRQERLPVKFARSFSCPCRVDVEKVTASLKNGVLTIELPKVPEAQPKQISVKVG